MHTNWCVLIEMSMEIGMLNFWMGLLVTALTKETYFSKSFNNYEDHLLPNFDPLSSIRTYNNCGQFTWFLPFVTWPSVDFLLTYSPSLLVHVAQWSFNPQKVSKWLHGSTWVFSSFSYSFMHNSSYMKICRLLFFK